MSVIQRGLGSVAWRSVPCGGCDIGILVVEPLPAYTCFHCSTLSVDCFTFDLRTRPAAAKSCFDARLSLGAKHRSKQQPLITSSLSAEAGTARMIA